MGRMLVSLVLVCGRRDRRLRCLLFEVTAAAGRGALLDVPHIAEAEHERNLRLERRGDGSSPDRQRHGSIRSEGGRPVPRGQP
jgi:hypothetical protein